MVRTARNKKRSDTGVMQLDKRGGRQQHLKAKDEAVRSAIITHINRFPRVESHYCRQKTTRDYLHSDLSIKRMYDMFRNEHEGNASSYQTYHAVFSKLKLSFDHPKKDQCSLCLTYQEGDVAKKRELEERYNIHIREKNAVRKIKEELKNNANVLHACAVFDLQQVLFLAISNNNKLFYRRRLACYNFITYDIKSKECDCFCWYEGISKHGACQITSCLYKYLNRMDADGKENVSLFCDSCSGQNKNSIVAAMLLHVVCFQKYSNHIVQIF